MKTVKSYLFLSLILIAFSVSSCQAIEAIFKAGVWSGILMVAVVIALLIFLIRMFMSKK